MLRIPYGEVVVYRPLNSVQTIVACMVYNVTKDVFKDVAIDDYAKIINPDRTDQQLANRMTELIADKMIDDESRPTEEGAKMLLKALKDAYEKSR